MSQLNYEELKAKIEQYVPQAKLRIVRESLLVENADALLKIAKLVKDSEFFRFDMLSSVTAADYIDFLETVYHFYSVEKKKGPFTLRVRCSRENPRIPSLVPVFRGAEFQERECYDMFGILYEGHPDLRRLFMWEGFEGYPLRKDYIQEDSETLEMEDVEWLEKRGIPVPAEMKKAAEDLRAQGKRAVAQKEGKEQG